MKPLQRGTVHVPRGIKNRDIVKESTKNDEVWKNDIYTVNVERGMKTGLFLKNDKELLVTHLSIKRNDNRAMIDWREFQWIKNQLVGEENEGVELYPAESRLVDGANQFHIWVVEDKEFRFPFGWSDRMVTQKTFFGETQRKFPELRKPEDLEENHQKMENFIEQVKSKQNG